MMFISSLKSNKLPHVRRALLFGAVCGPVSSPPPRIKGRFPPSVQIIGPALFHLMCLLLLSKWFRFNKSYEKTQTLCDMELDTGENAAY